jgi:hypothetical protein
MAQKAWKGRSAPAPRPPETISGVARRYHACAVALAKTLGLSLAEVLREHRESVTACFIETSRAELRLPAGVRLPPLARMPETPEAVPDAGRADFSGEFPENSPEPAPDAGETENPIRGRPPKPEPPSPEGAANGQAIPTSIPADGDLPCAGQEIADLKPAALAMLIANVARRVQDHQDGWVPLLHALNGERASRIERGRKPRLVPMEGDGHGR